MNPGFHTNAWNLCSLIDGTEYGFLYSADGSLLQQEETIASKTLPEPIAQAVTKAHPKATIK